MESGKAYAEVSEAYTVTVYKVKIVILPKSTKKNFINLVFALVEMISFNYFEK
jgi:hypothetical protein